MGLAPYGSHGSEQVARFVDIIKNKLIEIKDDGSIWLNQEYFSYATGLRMVYDDKWAEVLGFKRRESESLLEQIHCDFALAIQEVTEEVVIKMAQAPQLMRSDLTIDELKTTYDTSIAPIITKQMEIYEKRFDGFEARFSMI